MQRRRFLTSLGAAAGLLTAKPAASAGTTSPSGQSLFELWARSNDVRISGLLARQRCRAEDPFRGGFADRNDLVNPGAAAGATATLLAGYLAPPSGYYRSEKVAASLDAAIEYLLRMQHADGTIDLITTNFHSPPDTAFAVARLAAALSGLRQRAPDALPRFQSAAAKFLERAGHALRVGGIHTPNHRWVVCMALAWIHQLLPDPALVERIDRWLLEGIDIDPDGQYTERSIAVYSPTVDRSLLTIARLLKRPELRDPVRRNLAMTWYYFHANGQLATEASTRQDRYQIATAIRYYDSYRYLSLLDGDGRFAAVARLIERQVGMARLATNLITLLEDPEFGRELPPDEPLPTRFVKYFRHSKLVRIRRNTIDATILGDNARFFTFFKGNSALEAVRFATAFFGKGQFTSPRVRVDGNRYILRQDLYGSYYQPFPVNRIPGNGIWSRMPRHERRQSEIQKLRTTVTIVDGDGRFSLHFDSRGTDYVPWTIELAFRNGGTLSGVRALDRIDNAYLFEGREGMYRHGEQTITFGPGQVAHAWTQLRGAEPKMEAQSVYLTGYTPLDFTLHIE